MVTKWSPSLPRRRLPSGRSAVCASTFPPSRTWKSIAPPTHSPRTSAAGRPSTDASTRSSAAVTRPSLPEGSNGATRAPPARRSPKKPTIDRALPWGPSSVNTDHSPAMAWSAALPPKTGACGKTSAMPTRSSSSLPGDAWRRMARGSPRPLARTDSCRAASRPLSRALAPMAPLAVNRCAPSSAARSMTPTDPSGPAITPPWPRTPSEVVAP